MDVYEREATRRGGPLKDQVCPRTNHTSAIGTALPCHAQAALEWGVQVAREAITGELPRVYKAFMERQMETETTKNRALEAVLGACLSR